MTFWPLLFLFLVFLSICSLLVFFILLQKGKGEGLAGLLGGASASDGMGTPEAQKELSRWTTVLASIFFVFCLLLTFVSSRCAGPLEGESGPFAGEEAAIIPAPGSPEAEAPVFDITEGASPEAEVSLEVLASPEAEARAGAITLPPALLEAVEEESAPEGVTAQPVSG